MLTLGDLHIGQDAIIRVVGGEGELRHHLLDMGLTPGTEVTLRKTAPMGAVLRSVTSVPGVSPISSRWWRSSPSPPTTRMIASCPMCRSPNVSILIPLFCTAR